MTPDAMDGVADFRAPWAGGPPRPALDLTENSGIITAVANDIGTEAVFSRQVIAHGRPGDAQAHASAYHVLRAVELSVS